MSRKIMQPYEKEYVQTLLSTAEGELGTLPKETVLALTPTDLLKRVYTKLDVDSYPLSLYLSFKDLIDTLFTAYIKRERIDHV